MLIDDLRTAYQEAEAAWGPCDGHTALPQAAQLGARIEVGMHLLAAEPDNPAFAKHLRALERRYEAAKADPADRARCQQWREAFERFRDLEAEYLAAVRAGHDV